MNEIDQQHLIEDALYWLNKVKLSKRLNPAEVLKAVNLAEECIHHLLQENYSTAASALIVAQDQADRISYLKEEASALATMAVLNPGNVAGTA